VAAVRRGFLFVVPVATAAVVAWHPADPTTAADLGDQLSLYIGIHVVLLLLLPLLGLVLWMLLRDIESTPATVSRVLVVPAVAFYAAFDALVGIAAGVLAREALIIAQTDGAGAELLAARWMEIPWPLWLFGPLAQLCWIGAVAAAAVAHHRAESHPLAVGGLAVAALFAVHPRATGVAAMIGLLTAAVAIELRRSRSVGAES
jgi:hypothetical protein